MSSVILILAAFFFQAFDVVAPDRQVQASREALIEIMQLSSSEAAKSSAKLTELTDDMAWWTRIIAIATLVAIALALLALILRR